VRESTEVSKPDDFLLLFGESLQRSVNRLVNMPAWMSGLVRLLKGRSGRADGAERLRSGSLAAPAGPTAEPVDGAVARHSKEPWHELFMLVTECRRSIPRDSERLQYYLLGLVLILKHPLHQTQQPWGRRVDQRDQGLLVTGYEPIPER